MMMRRKFRAAAVLVGWAMILAGLVLLVALVGDVALHITARETPVFHAWFWMVFFSLVILGVLLVQTGEMAEALETMSEQMPGIARLIASVWPGGRRSTDKFPVVVPEPPKPPAEETK